MGCAAQPAMFSPASLNLYFGDNIKKNNTTLERTSYGLGSGATSIGLNPDTMKVHPMPPELVILRNEVTKVLTKDNKEWKTQLEQHPFNNCAIKIYYSYRNRNGKLVKKSTRWHSDVTYSKATKLPMRNNSQIPGSVVALLTFGATKNLWFRKQRSKKEYKADSLLHFQQKSGSLFALDGRDEMIDDQGYSWVHSSDMQGEEGITFTFSFRSVQTSVTVNPNGTMANPTMTEERRRKFQEGSMIFSTPVYQQDRQDLENKVAEFFQNNCKSYFKTNKD